MVRKSYKAEQIINNLRGVEILLSQGHGQQKDRRNRADLLSLAQGIWSVRLDIGLQLQKLYWTRQALP